MNEKELMAALERMLGKSLSGASLREAMQTFERTFWSVNRFPLTTPTEARPR